MKRLIFHISILLAAFIFGSSITKIYFVWNVQFEEFARGSFLTCGDLENGFKGGGGFVSYQSYDGVKLVFSHAEFDSAEIAESCFQSELQKAVKIVEREKLYDPAGEKIVGQRVVAVLPPNEYVKTEWVVIMRLDADRIIEVTSASSRHALIFEKTKRTR